MRVSKKLVAVLFAGAIAGFVQNARAATVYATGFENPPFVTGTLVPQDGWAASQVGPGVTNGTAVVETAVRFAGNQAVQVDKAANKDSQFYKPVLILPSGLPADRYVNVSWKMNYVPATGTQPFGPFFGVDAYKNTNIGRIGMGGVDAKTGEVLYFDPVTTLQPVPTGLTITGNVWHDFGLSFDYTTQKYFLYVDGLTTTPGGINFLSAASSFTDADLAGIAAAGDALSQAATGRAYFDDYSISTSATPLPEPAALTLLGIVGVVAGLRRRDRETVH